LDNWYIIGNPNELWVQTFSTWFWRVIFYIDYLCFETLSLCSVFYIFILHFYFSCEILINLGTLLHMSLMKSDELSLDQMHYDRYIIRCTLIKVVKCMDWWRLVYHVSKEKNMATGRNSKVNCLLLICY